MKKRILCMAMVLCMVMALLPATALAAENYPGVTVNLRSSSSRATKLTFIRGEDYIIETDENGSLVSQGVNENGYEMFCVQRSKYPDVDWNVRIHYTDDGMVITFRNAYINNTERYSKLLEISGNTHVTIALEGENVLKNGYAVPSGTWKDNGDQAAVMSLKATLGTTITGSGSLSLSAGGHITGSANGHGTLYGAAIESDYDLTIKNTTFYAEMRPCSGAYGTQTIRCAGNILIDNANVTVVADTYGSSIWLGAPRATLDTAKKNVTIQNGAKVTCSTKSTSESRHAITVGNGDIIIDAANGTEVTLQAVKKAFSKDPVITGNYTAVAGTSADAAAEYVAGGTYQYFKLEGATAPTLSEPMVAPVLNNTLDMDVAIAKNAVDADGYAMFVPANGGEPVRANLVDDPKDDSIYVARLTGLAAKQMTDSYTVTIYDGRGVEASLPRTFSIAEYAIAQLRATDDAELKTLLVDMLVYGAMAQNQFGHSTDKLATAGLTPEELNLATQTMTPCVNNLKSAAGYLGTTFILESSIAMATAYDKAVVGEGAYAVVSFTNYEGTAITSQPIYASEYSNDNTVVFISNDMVAADGRCEITWTIYNAAGEEVVEITDSLASYTKRAMDAGDDFVAKVMIYADSAAAYLGK